MLLLAQAVSPRELSYVKIYFSTLFEVAIIVFFLLCIIKIINFGVSHREIHFKLLGIIQAFMIPFSVILITVFFTILGLQQGILKVNFFKF